MAKMASVVDRYRAAIGANGITCDDLDVELGRAMMELMGMSFEGPHRFDMESL